MKRNIRKIISCTFLFLLAFPEAYCWTTEDLMKAEETAKKTSADLREMRIELARVNKELSGLLEDVKKANELNNWITVNGIQLCFITLEGHVYLCAVRGQGISMIHAASCPCRKKATRGNDDEKKHSNAAFESTGKE